MNNKSGLQAASSLDEEQLAEIKRLADLCDKADNIELKLNWNMLRERSVEERNDFLYYENGRLIGFLGIYQFRSTEAEISGMVHPDHRRQGIFGELVNAAKEECEHRGVSKLIFICQSGSVSGKAFLESFGAAYAFTEYWMLLNEGNRVSAVGDKGIVLRLAEPRDLPTIARLNAVGFDMTEEDALRFAEKSQNSTTSRTYVSDIRTVDGSLISIGKINVRVENGRGFIYGFVVAPEHRGQGFGREILNATISAIKDSDSAASVELEVAAENDRALGLYESCGFRETKATAYYERILE